MGDSKEFFGLETIKVDIAQIKIRDRVRKDLGDLSELKESLRTYGQINPILIDEEYFLIAGERRYQALKEIGSKEAEVKIVKSISDYDRISLELQENSTRKDFTMAEHLEALSRRELLEIKKHSLFRYYWEKIKRWFGHGR